MSISVVDGQVVYTAHDSFFDVDYHVTYNEGWHYANGLIVGKCENHTERDSTLIAVIVPGDVEPLCAVRIVLYPYARQREVEMCMTDFSYLDDSNNRKVVQTLLDQIAKHYGFRFVSVAQMFEIRQTLGICGFMDVPFYDVRSCNVGSVRINDGLWAWNDATNGNDAFAIIDKDV